MNDLRAQITNVKKQCIDAIQASISIELLEQARLHFLSRKGVVSSLMGCLKDLSLENKKEFGPLLNELKETLDQLFYAKHKELLLKEFELVEEKSKYFDVTEYLPQQAQGSLHVYTKAIHEIQEIFISMGYRVMDGPEVESDYYNFEALNIPQNHPARDMQDTFWIDVPGLVMRTHTSNVQVHTMETYEPPFSVIAHGRTFRNEATDASHDFMFRQLEGLVVHQDASIAQLIATVQLFLRSYFKKEMIKVRCRPSYFPFVEPGIEIDMSCPFCSVGCSTCKHSTWIEVMGAGLVHPQVLKAGGIDSQKYAGFAFGFGLTRLVMIKYGIKDIRLLHNPHVEFLKQF